MFDLEDSKKKILEKIGIRKTQYCQFVFRIPTHLKYYCGYTSLKILKTRKEILHTKCNIRKKRRKLNGIGKMDSVLSSTILYMLILCKDSSINRDCNLYTQVEFPNQFLKFCDLAKF